MTEQPPQASDPQSATPPPAYSAPPPPPPTPNPYGSAPPQAYGGAGPVGQIRGTGMSILLAIVTLGIYELVWVYKTSDERKRFSGDGLGGGLSLLLFFFVAPVMVFLMAAEIGNLQEKYGQPKTVSGVTGLWILLPLAGGIVWFVKVNGAINDFWKSQGVTA
jgi:hypothetical protein